MLNAVQKWLERLVAFDTRNGIGLETPCVEFLQQSLNQYAPDHIKLGHVARSHGKTEGAYVLAVWGRPKVILNVHIDTVPAGKGWTTDPFKLTRKGDVLHGLGACDIKGAAACMLAGLEMIKPQNVAILFSGDEEHGSEVMQAVIARNDYGQAPLAIVCEPTLCQIGKRHRGMLSFEVEWAGPGGHSSLADQVAAPTAQAARLATDIYGYGRKHINFGREPYKGLCVNIGDISGDGAHNVIPTQSSMRFSLRPPPGDSVKARENDIRKLCQSHDCASALKVMQALLPFETQDLSAFAPYFRAELSKAIDLAFWTEAALFNQAGVNAVVYGPGNIEQAHRPNEYVALDQLLQASLVYNRALSGQDIPADITSESLGEYT